MVIFSMFQHTIKNCLKDRYLLMIQSVLIILTAIMLLTLCIRDPYYLALSPIDSMNDYQYCTSKYQLTVYVPLILSTRFTLLLLTTICAYKIRKVPDLFNETRQLVFTVYNLSFLSIALPTIDLTMGRGKCFAVITYGICTFGICILTTLIMFVPKIILVLQEEERNKFASSTFIYSEKKSRSSTVTSFGAEFFPTRKHKLSETTITVGAKDKRQNFRGTCLYRSHSTPLG